MPKKLEFVSEGSATSLEISTITSGPAVSIKQQGTGTALSVLSSAGSVLASISATGSTTLAGLAGPLTLTNATAASKAFIVKGAAAQSGYLQDWQNSAGTSLGYISSAGSLTLAYSSSRYLTYDNTGTSKLEVRADNNGLMDLLTLSNLDMGGAPAGLYGVEIKLNLNRGSSTNQGGAIRLYAEDSYAAAGNRSSYMSLWTERADTLAEKLRITSQGALSIGGAPSLADTAGVAVFLTNVTTAPTTDPTGGGILFADAGALKWRGSSGTVTTIAAA